MGSRVRLPAFFVSISLPYFLPSFPYSIHISSIFLPYPAHKKAVPGSHNRNGSLPCWGMAIQMYEYDTSSMVFVHQNDKSRADPNTTFARKKGEYAMQEEPCRIITDRDTADNLMARSMTISRKEDHIPVSL